MAGCRFSCRTPASRGLASLGCSILRTRPTTPQSVRCRECCWGGLDPTQILFEHKGVFGDSGKSQAQREDPSGFAESSFGAYRSDHAAGTLKASGGVLGGGQRNADRKVIGTLTACDLLKGSTNNQSISNGLLVIDEKD